MLSRHQQHFRSIHSGGGERKHRRLKCLACYWYRKQDYFFLLLARISMALRRLSGNPLSFPDWDRFSERALAHRGWRAENPCFLRYSFEMSPCDLRCLGDSILNSWPHSRQTILFFWIDQNAAQIRARVGRLANRMTHYLWTRSSTRNYGFQLNHSFVLSPYA